MSDFAWPWAIPYQPLNDDLGQEPAQPWQASDFEQGLPRTRRMFRNAPTGFPMTWAFTTAEFRVFKGFYNVVGGGFFTMPLFVDTDYQTCRCKFDPKTPLKYGRSGGEWLVTAKVLTLDSVTPTISDYAIDLLMLNWDGTLDELVDLFENSIQVKYGESFP